MPAAASTELQRCGADVVSRAAAVYANIVTSEVEGLIQWCGDDWRPHRGALLNDTKRILGM
eukprot:7967556-Pyramimonas_sp.AAC.1